MSRLRSFALLAAALGFGLNNTAEPRPISFARVSRGHSAHCTRAKSIRGAAAHKRAARKRRNIARRASK